MSSSSVGSTYARFAKDPFKGGQGIKSFVLKAGTTDKVLRKGAEEFVRQAGGTDKVLQARNSCQDFVLQANTTDKVLKAGTTDRVLTIGTCTDEVVTPERSVLRAG